MPACSSRLSRSCRRHACGCTAISAASARARGERLRRARPPGSPAPSRAPRRRRDRPPGQHQVHRPRLPDQPRQPDRAAVDQRHAPAAAEHPEHRVLGGHPQVGPERQLAARRPPRDPRWRRSPAWSAASGSAPSGPSPSSAHPVAAVGADRGQVGAGAERPAGAGEHRDRGVVVGLERPERVRQRGRGRAVDGVAHLRPVDDHRGDRSVAADPDRHCS